jgi:undecaprenyl-diphosphatase
MVGAAQGAALLPGLSRSSMTLTSLLWLGVRAPRAVELCFLIWLPAGLASLLINRAGGPCPDKQMAALAMSTAMGAALAALYVLRAAATRRLLPAFSLYLVPLAFATMAWGYARP